MRGQGNSVLKINSEIPSVSKTCTNRGSVTCSQAVIITLGDGFPLLVLLQHVSKENGVLKNNNAQEALFGKPSAVKFQLTLVTC